jgi:hypothetical protein
VKVTDSASSGVQWLVQSCNKSYHYLQNSHFLESKHADFLFEPENEKENPE